MTLATPRTTATTPDTTSTGGRIPATGSAIPRGYRPEVQGLRALAVLMVVTYHVWLGRVSGGIDVFLLLSAFLMSGSLVRRLESGERVWLPRHWLHVFQRLVPAAAVVVVATLVASWLVLPATRWRDLLVEAAASLGYAQNWLLARRSVDYYAADQGLASPLQHFWSLSLQGQVFVLWPLLLVALAVLSRRSGWPLRRLVALAFGAVFVVSFVYSVVTTRERQAFAYFDGGARLWEFALGTLLALAAARVALPLVARVVLGWAGIVGMLSCGLVLQVTQAFPGYLALWPTLSAAAVLVAGRTGHRFAVDRVLSSAALVRLGGTAYTLYLVHWPVLVLWLAASGRSRAGLVDGAAVVGSSLVLALLLSRFVEEPLRRLPRTQGPSWRSATVVGAFLLPAVAVCGFGLARLDADADRSTLVATGVAVAQYPGARAVEVRTGTAAGATTAQLPVEDRLPATTALRQEFVSLPQRCSGAWAAEAPLTCTVQEPPGTASRTVVVVGDSHAEQWLAALQPTARAQGWRLVALLKGGCSFGDAASREGECGAINAAATDYLLRHRPDLVVTVSTAAHRSTAAERLVGGYPAAVRALTGRGIPVVGLRDNPRWTFGVVGCVLEEGDSSPRCRAPVTRKLAAANPADALAGTDGFASIDLTDHICPEGVCPPSVGNVWVYLDDNHLTRTYAATLAPVLERRLRDSGVWP
ncbi:acyltransferase family protein [Pedococcus aerophilus]|uniref:Acyltransferase family protein n=1 Tax=Pedococcus aerophilus TaxID=436356 RepID=A0ABP6H1C4_9MICO